MFVLQTEHSFKSINKLRKGTPYQFQLVAVDSDGIIGEPAISTWNTTLTGMYDVIRRYGFGKI